MDKDIIRRNFSKRAADYDGYSIIQKMCSLRLISQLGNGDFSEILEIGCGTGGYTGLLRNRFPAARIKAVDISENMIKIAKKNLAKKGITFSILDCEQLDIGGRFSLITSNAVFQWLTGLRSFLERCRDHLRERGSIVFSTFGLLTFRELSVSLKDIFGDDTQISSDCFLGHDEIKKTLESIFGQVETKEWVYRQEYETLYRLLDNIKYTGARGTGINSGNIWTRKTVDKLERVYKQRFGAIIATYQIFFCHAKA